MVLLYDDRNTVCVSLIHTVHIMSGNEFLQSKNSITHFEELIFTCFVANQYLFQYAICQKKSL